MNINAHPYPIYVTSAWGKSPRMVADEFAAEYFAEPRKVFAFDPDGTFTLVDGTRTYRVVMQPGRSETTYGIMVEEPSRCG